MAEATFRSSVPPLLLRPIRALATLPSASGWAYTGVTGTAGAAVIGVIAAVSGFLGFAPHFTPAAFAAFAVPAFTEELVFRGFLAPPPRRRSVVPALLTSTVLFSFWHVVEALTFLRGATLFLTPGFLLAAAVLGITAGAMRLATNSLWPPIVFHGTIVVLWQSLFDAPSFADLIA